MVTLAFRYESLPKSNPFHCLSLCSPGVLLTHVVPGVVFSNGITNSMHVTSLSGERLTLNTENGPQVDLTHNIIGADIPASNGVIHIIDSVIVPN